MWMITLLFITSVAMLQAQDSSITFLPDVPRCIGEEVEMICYIESRTLVFIDSTTLISLNGSTPTVLSIFNAVNSINGIDTSRYTASITDLSINTSRPGVRVTISDYQASDGSVGFGCAGLLSGGVSSGIFIQRQPQRLADPPSSPVVTLSRTGSRCSYNRISWATPDSDREITEYSVYRNGTFLTDTTSNQDTDYDRLDDSTVYEYSVVAISCAGTSIQGVNNTSIGEISESTTITLSLSFYSTNGLVIDWTIDPTPQSIYLTYDLLLEFRRPNIANPYTVSRSFWQYSTDTDYYYTIDLRSSSLVGFSDDITLELTATLTITEPCSLFGISDNASANFIIITKEDDYPTALVTFLIIFIILLLVSVAVIVVLSLLLVLLYRKLQAHKQTASVPKDPYEYIDMDNAAEHVSTVKSADSTNYTAMSPVPADNNPQYSNLSD